MLPRVGVLHRPGAAAGLPEIYRSAQDVCEPVIFIDESAADPQARLMAEELFQTELVTAASLASRCRSTGVQGLTAFHDIDLDLVDASLGELGFAGLGAVADPWDKLVQRQRMPADISVTATAVESEHDFVRAIAEVGLPAVLKPRRATGGEGVALLHSTADVSYQLARRQQWRGYLAETMLQAGRHPSGVSYLGDFVSVETVNSAEGRQHVACFDKTPVSVAPHQGVGGSDLIGTTGDVFPSRLSQAVRGQVLDAVTRCLDSLDIQNRITHTEVKLTPAGPRIIEVNGRVGGHLNRLLATVGGTDLVRAALQLALGQLPDSPAQPPTGCVLGYYPSFPVRRDEVRSRVTLRDIRNLPSVVAVSELAQHGRPQAATSHRMVNLVVCEPDFTSLDAAAGLVDVGVRELFAADMVVDDARGGPD